MKLALIQPCVGRSPRTSYPRGWQMEPLGMAYLASATPSDVEITFWDDRMEAIDFAQPVDLAAITVETYTARRAYQIASAYRRRGVPVVLGGFHPTLVPDEAEQYAEAIVIGEAEALWAELLRDFQNGRLARRYQSTARPAITETLPQRTIYQGRPYLSIGLVERGRGCLARCDFCAITAYHNASYSLHSTETILEDIRRCGGRRKTYFFVDDNLATSLDELKEFLEALIPLKLRWVSQGSIHMSHDRELLKLLRLSGCQGMLVGFESLNRSKLAQMNKRFNAARGGAAEAVARFHAAGIRLYGTFIFGYDGDTVDDFQRTLDFCLEHKLFVAAFNHLIPFPGTPLYHRMLAEGRLPRPDWWLDSNYRFGDVPFHSEMPAANLMAECLRARQRYYSRRSIVRRWLHPLNRSPRNSLFFLWANLLLRGEIMQRLKLPLGDLSVTSPLLRSECCPGESYCSPPAELSQV